MGGGHGCCSPARRRCSPPPRTQGVTGAPPLLRRAFTHAAHKGVVKCVAAGGRYVASGGADDTIHLFDQRVSARTVGPHRRCPLPPTPPPHTCARVVPCAQGGKDLGFLVNPGEGAVTALAFHAPASAPATHLLSGAADGTIRRVLVCQQPPPPPPCTPTLPNHPSTHTLAHACP